MQKTIIIIIFTAVLIFGVYYIAFKNNSNTTLINNSETSVLNNPNTNTPINSTLTPKSTTSKTSTTSKSSSVVINIKNFTFSPSTITVKKGTKITWINNDNVSHTVTSDSGNLLSSGFLFPDSSYVFIPQNLGPIKYHCNIHKAMKGIIIVE